MEEKRVGTEGPWSPPLGTVRFTKSPNCHWKSERDSYRDSGRKVSRLDVGMEATLHTRVRKEKRLR